MANFGELVLVLGDHHIGYRSHVIPEEFQRMLVPNKMQHVICTGNLGSSKEQFQELRQLAPNVHVVKGDCDDAAGAGAGGAAGGGGGGMDGPMAFPDTRVIHIGEFRYVCMHGL